MIRFHIPIRLPSLSNERFHWRTLARIKKKQKEATMYCMIGLVIPQLPLVVTITRIGPRKLDDDNLASACKYVRDQIAKQIGVDDGSSDYTWLYSQRIGKNLRYGVDVEISRRT
jgi:hypothetical protein